MISDFINYFVSDKNRRRRHVVALFPVAVQFAGMGAAASANPPADPSASPTSPFRISMACEEGSTKQTKFAKGPRQLSASLLAKSHDDYSKDYHNCKVEYHINILPDLGIKDAPLGFFGSDDDWGRMISATLAGFSQDGNKLFGIISESGEYPATFVFSHDVTSPRHEEYELTKSYRLLRQARCGNSFDIVGTTERGNVVVEPATADQCRTKYRWSIDPKTSNLLRLSRNQTVIPLFPP